MSKYDNWLNSGNPEDEAECPECGGDIEGDKWGSRCAGDAGKDRCEWSWEANFESIQEEKNWEGYQ